MTGLNTHAGPPQQDRDWPALAIDAAAEVNFRFGHRLMGLPGTWIGELEIPRSKAFSPRRRPWSEWHYWWQAHYLDAMIDTGLQTLSQGNRLAARTELRRARHLLRGIMIHNFGRFPNYFYDDMAWLALAASRLNQLSRVLIGSPDRLASCAVTILTRQLHGAHDSVLDGGIYWSRKRDYKNTPVNGPAALHFARNGDAETAQAISAWLRASLFDPATGLYLDGIHPSSTGSHVETNIYTYNQGPILGALLELGRPQDLADATALIEAISQSLRPSGNAPTPGSSHAPSPGLGVRLEPGGDGSLFTGILCRYLALAARDGRLSAHGRETASSMVKETAETVIKQSPQLLSAAVQRWTILSAAASIR